MDSFINQFIKEFEDNHYPAELLHKYELIECLAHNEQGETLLVKERQTGNLQVAKCYPENASLSSTSESDLLRNIHNKRLPAFIGEYQSNGMTIVLREYIEGVSLDQFAREHPITQEEALSICTQICDDLAYLHGQTPPIIHRDIKPQNIIIDDSGNPRLIDFGNSRLYNENSQTDTVCFGTRYYAAPEQYGFSQTDGRTDIFALGVLLGWLLTGETEVKKALIKIPDKQLGQIVKKCTEFAPDKRYSTALQVKTDLLRVIRQTRKKLVRWLTRVAVCSAFLLLGFSLGRYTDLSFAVLDPGSVKFSEPLIEQAVRLELGKAEYDTISKDDLLKVTEVYIYGNHAVSSQEEFIELNQHMTQEDGVLQNGGMTSLKDLAMLKNLRVVSIALQNIHDPSPLKKLVNLEQVELKHNPIEEVESIAGMQHLRELFIFDTQVSDLTELASCPKLEKLDIGSTLVSSPDNLAGITNMTSLYAFDTNFTTLKGIEKFEHLQEIALTNVIDGDLSPLLSLPQLKTVYLRESLREAAEKSLEQANFEIIFQ